MSNRKIAVVGGGLAGLMATIKAAEAGVPVDLFSIVPVKRSHSVCAQGGIKIGRASCRERVYFSAVDGDIMKIKAIARGCKGVRSTIRRVWQTRTRMSCY